jgi:CubicO group peptidase (beta-lactamase class C family)
MRLTFTSFLVCIAVSLSAQSVQQHKTDSVTRLLKDYYNKKDAAGLYSVASEKFKQALPEQTLQQTFETLNTQIGQLSAYELETFNDNLAKYKATFTNVVLTLYVGLDEKDKLETFRLVEYKAEPLPKKVTPVPTNNPLQSSLDKKTDSMAQAFMSLSTTVGMVIGILDKGKTQVYAYGETVKGSKKLPDGNTLFEIGSISKTFTATLLAHFVQQGKIKLEDPINKYLPDSIAKMEFNGKPITIQSLSNHSSGLPRVPDDLFVGAEKSNPYKHYDNKKLFAYLKQFKPTREPGAQYDYSNLAVGLLGVILERVSGKTYEQLVKEIIWKPLKMDNSRITLLKEDSAKFAQGYDERVWLAHSWEFQSLAACGAIRSGMNDMLLYAGAQVNDGNSSLQNAIRFTHQQTYVNGQTRVALGWHIMPSGEQSFLWHNGQTGGYRSTFVFDEQNKRSVIILTNANVAPDAIGLSLLKWFDKK